MPEDEWSQREIDRGEALDREVDRLKRIYGEHAEALSRLAATAPTKQLARRYRELIAELNNAIVGLGDAEQAAVRRVTAERALPPESLSPAVSTPVPPPAAKTPPPPPLAKKPAPAVYTAAAPSPDDEDKNLLRIVLMIGLALLLIAILAVFVWKFSGERPTAATPAETATTASPDAQPTTTITEPVSSAATSPLRVRPETQDYGVVYKGTRIVKTYEITNATSHDIALEISRSKCKCLWFDYPKTIPANGRGTISVAVDGSRAAAGTLSESIELSARGVPGSAAAFAVNAEIK